MKLQLDTNAKTIKVEEDANLSELISKIKKLLPKGEWKEYTLQSSTTIEWYGYPVITYDYIRPWWENPVVTFDTNSLNIKSDGSYINTPNLCDSTANNVTVQTNTENYMDNEGIYNIQL